MQRQRRWRYALCRRQLSELDDRRRIPIASEALIPRAINSGVRAGFRKAPRMQIGSERLMLSLGFAFGEMAERLKQPDGGNYGVCANRISCLSGERRDRRKMIRRR